MNEDGAEHLYSIEIDQPVVNFGVSVLAASAGALIDPFVLGSKDENDVQGYAGIPTDVNALTFDGGLDIGAAGVQFPRLQRFYVAVDSRADAFTNQPQKGKYLLNAWANDLTPPAVRLLTTRVTAGRPLIVAQAVDSAVRRRPALARPQLQEGARRRVAYDPVSGLVVFGLPPQAPRSSRARRRRSSQASDYQEAKNINTVGNALCRTRRFLRGAAARRHRPDRLVDRAARARLRAGDATSWSSSPTRRRGRAASSSATASG